eukprot:767031-Amphidinium_carterae.1
MADHDAIAARVPLIRLCFLNYASWSVAVCVATTQIRTLLQSNMEHESSYLANTITILIPSSEDM